MTRIPTPLAEDTTRASWAPMIGIFLAQVLMSFNVAALPISIGNMVDDFDVAPTTVGTTIVVYSVAVAALVMVGAKLGQRVGWGVIFRIVVVIFGIAELMMVLAPTVGWVIAAQGLAGASAAIIVPALVALIAENYHGRQQATAIGSLGSARAISGVSAFLIGGALGTLVGWRPIFVILLFLAVVVFALSFKFRADRGDPGITIDIVGAALIGVGVVLLTLGFNNLNGWGIITARPDAPFAIGQLSPALLLVLIGVVLIQAFIVWTRRRTRLGQVPLVSLSILQDSTERAAVYAMFIIVALEGAINFTVPLYIQIVQGRTPFDTSLAMMPFSLTVFIVATLVVRTYDRFTPRAIGVFSFGLCTVALVWLSFVVTNNWETVPTIVGLIAFGIGQGALVTLVFNVLVTAAPKELAGDVGSVRGTTQNLALAVGTALAGALLVTALSWSITQALTDHDELPDELVSQVELDGVDFVSNDNLRELLEGTNATQPQIEAAIKVNSDARLEALRLGLLIYAGFCVIAILPASRLPSYRPGEIPEPDTMD